MGGEACNEHSCSLIGHWQWVGPPSHLRLCSFRMEHYIQTRGYAMPPEALVIRDNVTENIVERKRAEAENNSKGKLSVKDTSDCIFT